jgi:membrane protease YdiL (CAAX protease family)
MEIGVLIKFILILAITVFLLMRKENNQLEHFPQQTWSIKEVLPFYWCLIFILIIWLILFETRSDGHRYIIVSYILTFLACSIIFFAVKKITGRRGILPIKAIGAKSTDLYWLLFLTAIQYSILLVYLYSRNSLSDPLRILYMSGYFSITLLFFPILESVLYFGMMLIPTSRIVGLVKSAVLISLLQALSHFNYSSAEVVINFTIFGLLGCYLYIKSKRIIVPLIVHSSINFLVLIRELKFF